MKEGVTRQPKHFIVHKFALTLIQAIFEIVIKNKKERSDLTVEKQIRPIKNNSIPLEVIQEESRISKISFKCKSQISLFGILNE
jgi:hypothetical protein